MQSVPTEAEFNSLAASVKTIADRVTAAEAEITKLKAVPAPTPTPTTNVYDDFNYAYTFPSNGSLSPNGKWKLEYTSNGYAKVENGSLVMQPGGSTLTNTGGSAKVNSTKQFANFRATYYVTTEAQVYADKAGWMSAWTIFRFVDKWRHWYIGIGLDHIEIGKKDAPTSITDQNQIEQYQYTLWTGPPATPLNTKRKIQIEFIGNTLKLWVDDLLLKTLVDDGTLKNQRGEMVKQSSWTTGLFCPYTEGSRSRYWPMTIETL
jgi:hypothetical protein